MNVLSARVVEFRKKKGLTQEQLAKEINVSRGVLAGIECGLRTPSKEMAKRLAAFFNVPLEIFVCEGVATPEQNNKTISTAQILMIADIVEEYLKKYGYKITPEQRVMLVEHFYQMNITDANKIKEMLSFAQAMGFNSPLKN